MNNPSSCYTTSVYSQCNLCSDYLNKGSELKHVFTIHAEQNEFRCIFCSYSGVKKVDLQRHQEAKHNFQECFLACPVCDFMSKTEEGVHKHILFVHFSIKKLSLCKYCSFKTEDTSQMSSHINRMHSDYVCLFQACRAICLDPYKLFSHYVEHFPKLTLYYSCSESECDYMHTMYTSLYQHQRDKHDIFDETYDDTYVLIKCKRCSYETYDKEDFKEHIRDENHFILYNCPFKKCSYKSDLFWSFTQHFIDKHLYEITAYYYCFECGEGFSQLNSVIQHLRDKHEIKKVCSKCQTYHEDLADHIDNDHDELYDEYYSCRICNDEFEDKTELVDHLTTDHSINIPSEVKEVTDI